MMKLNPNSKSQKYSPNHEIFFVVLAWRFPLHLHHLAERLPLLLQTELGWLLCVQGLTLAGILANIVELLQSHIARSHGDPVHTIYQMCYTLAIWNRMEAKPCKAWSEDTHRFCSNCFPPGLILESLYIPSFLCIHLPAAIL